MTKKNYPKNAAIVLPKSSTFKYRTAVNANPKCASITVTRRLNEMVAAGTITRLKKGVYCKADDEQLQLNYSEHSHIKHSTDMSLYDYMRLNDRQKVEVMERALSELVRDGVVTKHGDKYSVA